MDSNTYIIRNEALAWVSKAIGVVKLPKNENGNYMYDDATLFLQQIDYELTGSWRRTLKVEQSS